MEHCDLLLVGDSVGDGRPRLPNTVGVTLEMMILHGQAVMRGSTSALVVVDMPFGSYEGAAEEAYRQRRSHHEETGAQAVKVEAGPAVVAISSTSSPWHPVMGHVGLRPQAVLVMAASRARARASTSAGRSWRTPAHRRSWRLRHVVEGVAEGLARGNHRRSGDSDHRHRRIGGCDGQILVTDDMLGLFRLDAEDSVRRYADLRGGDQPGGERLFRGRPGASFPGAGGNLFRQGGMIAAQGTAL
jgi:3-methyl-2-oxobutanoate hydroxymethyltransferase